MATSDLLNELQKDTFRVDGEMEKKLCAVILNQLDDQSGDSESDLWPVFIRPPSPLHMSRLSSNPRPLA